MIDVERVRESKLVVFVIVYMMFLLDNVLLTVVVPIIPDYLFSNVLNYSNHNTNKYAPISLSPLQRKYEILENDNGPLGALLASKAFVQLAFTPVVGYLTQILDCSIPLLIGSCNMFVAAILFAYGNSYGVLVVARALHGSSSAAIGISGMCILAKNVPKNSRNTLMPLSFGGIALGVLIGYPLGGAAYQLFGKTAPFMFIAVFILITIGLQVAFLRSTNQETYEYSENLDSTYTQWLSLLKDKVTLISGLAICISTSSMAILEPCVPIWLLVHMKPRPTKWQLGAVFIPDSLGYFIGSNFAGLLQVEPWRVSISAMVVAGLSCCYLPLSNTITQLAVPHFGLGLGVGAVDASLVPLLANFVDSKGSSQYGPIYAFQQAAVAIAYSFGPLLGGQAVEIVGFPWLMRLMGFLNLMFCPLLLELESRQNGQEKPLFSKDNQENSYSTLESLNSFTEENVK